ncbi:hypothetical protein J437_LFUL004282 [Ladona fulva]|uniref:BRISC complex subunit FAM175B n=1 Tax=Ladona fulva TaxID=123851 RepID=A0A8K0JX73_LADFU|nr:hypothetical protein J437_LFUL004282 [Ladona fulva]
MAANVCVSTSGPVLSFLLYENVNSATNQEGFLLGEIVNKETNTISDFQINGKETATLISVHSIMPLPSKFSFYNHVGKVNAKKLKEILKEKAKEVVGWFRFRRNTSLTLHLSDKAIHRQLSEILLPRESRYFYVMCILSSSKSSNESTHRFNHAFYTQTYSDFEPIPLNVDNLGDTSISGYKLVSNTACSSDSFQNIISSLKLNRDHFSESKLVLNMQILLKKHLQKLVHDLSISESRVSTLQKEVNLLKSQLKSGKVSNELLLPQLLSMPVKNLSEPISVKTDELLSENEKPVTVGEGAPRESEQTDGSEDDVTIGEAIVEDLAKESNSSSSPVPAKTASDPFDFVTELKNEMAPATPPIATSTTPSGTRKHVVTDSPKGSGGVTGAKRKQSSRVSPSSPSMGSHTSGGDGAQGKGHINRYQRSSPQRSVRKVSNPENQRQLKTRQSASIRAGNNNSQDN